MVKFTKDTEVNILSYKITKFKDNLGEHFSVMGISGIEFSFEYEGKYYLAKPKSEDDEISEDSIEEISQKYAEEYALR